MLNLLIVVVLEKYLIHLTGREKPQEVSEMQYDISDNKGVAKGSARDFARTEALRYFERFHEPNIAEELSALIKNSNLYSNLTPAETKHRRSTRHIDLNFLFARYPSLHSCPQRKVGHITFFQKIQCVPLFFSC